MNTTTSTRGVRPERICVIGAGPCGISAAKNLLDAGFRNLIVYEQNEAAGGSWLFSENPRRHTSVYQTTHLVSSKTLSEFQDYPMPSGYPDFPSHAQLLEYFQGYVRNFDVDDYIEFSSAVKHVSKDASGRWVVSVENNDSEKTERFDYLVVCNGHHWDPKLVQYPGEFAGALLHSHNYTRAGPFRDKRVLVIGGGNSACDIVVEVSRVAKAADISIRHGGWYMPKLLFGLPTDALYSKLHRLPERLQKFCMESAIRLHVGCLAPYGLPAPDGRVYETTSVYNSELLYFIRHGKIRVRRGIEFYEGNNVRFTDGTSGEYDIIIAATGFKVSFPFFDRAFLDFDTPDFHLHHHIFHPNHDNLFFIGLGQPSGCIWVVAELQSKVMARHIKGGLQVSSRLGGQASSRSNHTETAVTNKTKFSLHLDYPSYRKRLLKMLRTSERPSMDRKCQVVKGLH